MLGLEDRTLRRSTVLGLIDDARALLRQASVEVMRVYRNGTKVMTKEDGSPLTQADLLAHRILSEGLAGLSPHLPVVSEEDKVPSTEHSSNYWLIDPVDGTREFIARTGEFSVNAALISDGVPIWGGISAPVEGRLYEGGKEFGSRSWEGMHPQVVRTAISSPHHCRVLVSRSYPDIQTERLLVGLERHFASLDRKPLGSSLKFCALAVGDADLYPRMMGIWPWDIAAGQAVLEGAGGGLLTLEGKPPVYRSEDRNRLPAFVACGDLLPDWLALIRQVAEKN